jgi:predicted nucleotidyltransferase
VRNVVLPDDVVSVLACDARIQRAELTGSRARGTATALSDWDFTVTVAEFDAVREALPSLTAPLRPVVRQWDGLSRHWCYMMILTGPAKVDLIFGQPHPIAPPWRVSAATLTPIDDHFWDWALWLGSKQRGGREDVVAAELGKLHAHLLGPLGVAAVPGSLRQAVAEYRAAREDREKALGCRVSRAAESTVLPSLRGLTRGID